MKEKFEAGKEYHSKLTDVCYTCVFVGNNLAVMCGADNHHFSIPSEIDWRWEPKAVEERFMSIKFTDAASCVGVVLKGPKHRADDNVKFTFTNNILTKVELI